MDTVTALRALTSLSLFADASAPQTAHHPDNAAAESAAGAALVQRIGTCTQLELTALMCVHVRACCQHLAGLTNLACLTLWLLNLTPPAVGAHAADRTFEQLLVGMTQLRAVGLNGSSAMRVFSEVVSKLVNLDHLVLDDNQVGPAPAVVLAQTAKELPALKKVLLSKITRRCLAC